MKERKAHWGSVPSVTLIVVDPQLHNRYPVTLEYLNVRKNSASIKATGESIFTQLRVGYTYQLWIEQGGVLEVGYAILTDSSVDMEFPVTMVSYLEFGLLPDAVPA